jgi:hypothetical protein
MATRGTRYRLSVAALPLLALALFLPARALFRCASDQVARAACCCGRHDVGGVSSSGAGVGERCCCDSVAVGAVSPAQFSAVRTAPALPPLYAALGASVVSVAPRDAVVILGVPRTLHSKVPLFVLKRSLLI